MALKLSKQQRKEHDLGMEAVRSREGYVGENYDRIRLGATSDKGSVFMTPWELASEFSIESITHWTGTKRVLDLCAGYGALSLAHWHEWRGGRDLEVTCLERDERIAEIGELIFPEAKWITASVFDHERYLKGKRFHEFFSNPPFGAIPNGLRTMDNIGDGKWEWAVAEIGMQYADVGTMICARGCTDWEYSGKDKFKRVDKPRYRRWSERTGIQLRPTCLDASGYKFEGASVVVEIVDVRRTTDV